MPSSRLAKYLHTLERLPAITDTTTVREVIEASGLPTFEPVIEFHCKYAGFVQPYGRVQFIWGLFHEFPHDYSLNPIYFENRSFSSSGSRCFLTHKRSLIATGVVLI